MNRAFCHNLAVGGTPGAGSQGHQAPALLHAVRLQLQLGSGRHLLSIAHLAASGEAPEPLQPEPVGHHLVERREQQSAVGDAGPAAVLLPWREGAPTDVAVQPKLHAQADGIDTTAGKAVDGAVVDRKSVV